MKFTQNYNLKKPDYSDFAEIPDHFNGNFDIIDEKLKEYIDALIAHKAESASKHITEHGQNENGSYIKFDDGTMICTNVIDVPSTDITTSNGSAFYTSYNLEWLYPAKFINPPVVALESCDYRIDDIWINNITSIIVSYRPAAYKSITTASRISLLAIGRWK